MSKAWSGLKLLHGVSFLLGAVVAAGLIHSATPQGDGDGASGPPAHEEFHSSADAPWGRLEYTTILLERPDESIPPETLPPRPLRWFFEGYSEEQLRALFESTGLGAGEKHALQDRTRWQSASNGWWVVPVPDLVLNMGEPVRRQLYTVLGRSLENPHHAYPQQFSSTDFEAWLGAFSGEDQDRIRKLVYKRKEGGRVCFSDSELVVALCPPPERARLLKAFSRTESLVVRLRVTPDSDTASLARYWDLDGRGKALKPLLDSLARLPEGGTLDVSSFFPGMMRTKLYTYPRSKGDSDLPPENCYWTAMNFFNRTPDDRFVDGEHTWRVLSSEYMRLQEAPVFGDLISLVDERREAVHLCVYLADGVVFTKNGIDLLSPWVLMRLPDVMRMFPQPLEAVGFRRKAS